MLPEQMICILDVGHGNATIIRTRSGNVLIDGGLGSTCLSFLVSEGMVNLDLVIVSHADADHIAGVLGLITSKLITIRDVRVNSDADKSSKHWDDLLYELEEQRIAGSLTFQVALTAGQESFSYNPVSLEVLAPSGYLAGKGPGGVTREGKPITTNTISAVVRLLVADVPTVLLAGDIDAVGLEHMLHTGVSPHAPVLVFPHHGGAPGEQADKTAFAATLLQAVNPETVIFSNGRGRYDLPAPEIVAAVKAHNRLIRIACTQLSKLCAAAVPPEGAEDHLVDTLSAGRVKRFCCAGTFVLDLDGGLMFRPNAESHAQFVDLHAPTALCRGRATLAVQETLILLQ